MTYTPPAGRLKAEWDADQDVVRNLRSNGDCPELVRMIDVSFRGGEDALGKLADAAEEFGLTVIEQEDSEDGEPWLFLHREQQATDEAIKDLTILCLQIEADFGVEYDGWGCVAQTGTKH